tara:strand:- start:435 stop:1193 length:759 start_codon:yes stop_codon:yes gene_type:complete
MFDYEDAEEKALLKKIKNLNHWTGDLDSGKEFCWFMSEWANLTLPTGAARALISWTDRPLYAGLGSLYYSYDRIFNSFKFLGLIRSLGIKHKFWEDLIENYPKSLDIIFIYFHNSSGFVLTNKYLLVIPEVDIPEEKALKVFLGQEQLGEEYFNSQTFYIGEIKEISFVESTIKINSIEIGTIATERKSKEYLAPLFERVQEYCKKFNKIDDLLDLNEESIKKLKKLKDLLDMKIINEDEFNAKKEALLKEV